MKRLLTTVSFLCILFICASIGAPQVLSETLVLASLSPMSGGGQRGDSLLIERCECGWMTLIAEVV